MSHKKNTLKNLLIALCAILLLTGVVLLSAALMQPETSFRFENPAFMTGALPEFFIAGRFTSRKSSREIGGCLAELLKPIIYLFFWWIYLPLWLIGRKKK